MNLLRSASTRLGTILSNMLYLYIAVLVAMLLSQILNIVIIFTGYFIWIMLMLATLFILLLDQNFLAFPDRMTEFMESNHVFNFAVDNIKILLIAAMGLAVVSTLLLFLDRSYKHRIWRIVLNIVTFAIIATALIGVLVLGV